MEVSESENSDNVENHGNSENTVNAEIPGNAVYDEQLMIVEREEVLERNNSDNVNQAEVIDNEAINVPAANPQPNEALGRAGNDIPVVREVEVESDQQPVVKKKASKRKKCHEPVNVGVLSDDSLDADQKCSICLEAWTNYGDHRLCCLRCGHLFGLKCIKQWLEQFHNNVQSRRCPECNTKAAKKDIRVLYAKQLYSLDNAEEEKLKEQLKKTTMQKELIEKELTEYKTKVKMYEYEMSNLKEHIQKLQLEKLLKLCETGSDVHREKRVLQKERSFSICQRAGCRVMAYNPWHRILVASLKSTHPTRSDHGISKIDLESMIAMPYRRIHNGAIRDLDFQAAHPNMLLSVGFDKRVILTDIRNNCRELIHYKEDAQLWSCAWSKDRSHYFYAGTQNGCIVKYDIRQITSGVDVIPNTDDLSPIVSLATVPSNSSDAFRTGGLLACHLNTCYAHTLREDIHQGHRVDLDGPFMSVRYDEKNNHSLISCRSNPRQPHVRHYVCHLDKNEEDGFQCNIVHTFLAGAAQKILSKPCYMYTKDDTLVVANNDSASSVLLWSLSSGQEVYKLPVHDFVVDTCSFEISNKYLAILTLKDLHLYNYREDGRTDSFTVSGACGS